MLSSYFHSGDTYCCESCIFLHVSVLLWEHNFLTDKFEFHSESGGNKDSNRRTPLIVSCSHVYEWHRCILSYKIIKRIISLVYFVNLSTTHIIIYKMFPWKECHCFTTKTLLLTVSSSNTACAHRAQLYWTLCFANKQQNLSECLPLLRSLNWHNPYG